MPHTLPSSLISSTLLFEHSKKRPIIVQTEPGKYTIAFTPSTRGDQLMSVCINTGVYQRIKFFRILNTQKGLNVLAVEKIRLVHYVIQEKCQYLHPFVNVSRTPFWSLLVRNRRDDLSGVEFSPSITSFLTIMWKWRRAL